jgi:hypothetical protein
MFGREGLLLLFSHNEGTAAVGAKRPVRRANALTARANCSVRSWMVVKAAEAKRRCMMSTAYDSIHAERCPARCRSCDAIAAMEQLHRARRDPRP